MVSSTVLCDEHSHAQNGCQRDTRNSSKQHELPPRGSKRVISFILRAAADASAGSGFASMRRLGLTKIYNVAQPQGEPLRLRISDESHRTTVSSNVVGSEACLAENCHHGCGRERGKREVIPC